MSAGIVSVKAQVEGTEEIKKLRTELDALKQSGAGVAKPLQQNAKSLDAVGNASQTATKQVSNYNKEQTKTSKTTQDVERKNQSLGKSIQSAAGGFALAGSAAISLWNAYDNVGDSAAKVEISENKLNATELKLSKSREALVKLQQSGTASALDLQQAQQQVAVAEGNVERAAFNLTNAQEALNEAWLNAATSIIPAVFTGISGISQIMTAFQRTSRTTATDTTATATSMQRLGATATTTSTSVGGLTRANTLASSSLTQVGTAATTSRAAVGGLTAQNTLAASSLTRLGATGTVAGAGISGGFRTAGLAAKGFMLQLGPIGLIMIAIGAAFTAVATNAFGLRDKLSELGKTIGDMVPQLRPVLDAFTELGKVLGIVPADAEDVTEATGDVGDAMEVANVKQMQFTEELKKMSPILHKTAADWGLYAVESGKATLEQERQMAALQELNTRLEPARQGVIDLATANGVNLLDALTMTDEEIVNFVLNMETMGPTAEMQAEMTAQAAQKIADEWQASFERISQAQREFGESMRSAMGKMGEELGEEMEVGLSDLEKKVTKGFVGFTDQFFEEIFPEDFLATAIIEGNDPDDIADELKDLMHDVVDEDIITKSEAKGLIQPMIDYFDQDLPSDVEEPLAYMAGQLPSLLEEWKPAIVNGVVAVGAAGKKAVDQYLVQPMMQGLQGLSGGASGLDFGRGFLDNIRASLPAIEAEAGPEIAELIQGLLDAKNLGLDQKVQGIIDVIDQIRPGFKETIMGMDADADGIADIMDNKVLTPIEQMKLGILEAFQAIFEAIGKTEWANALGKEISELTGEFEGFDKQVNSTTPTVAGFTQAEWDLMSPMERLSAAMEEQQKGHVALETAIDAGSKPALEGMTQAEWDAMSPFERVGDAMRAQETAANALPPVYRDVAVAVDTAKESFDAYLTTVRGLLTQKTDAAGDFLERQGAGGGGGGGAAGFTQQVTDALAGAKAALDQWVIDMNAKFAEVPSQAEMDNRWGMLSSHIANGLGAAKTVLFNWIGEVHTALGQTPDDALVSSAWGEVFNAVGGALGQAWQALVNWTNQVHEQMGTTPDDAQVSTAWGEIIPPISDALNTAKETVFKWVGDVHTALGETPDDRLVSSAWGQVFNIVGGALGDAWQAVLNWSKNVHDKMGTTPDNAKVSSAWTTVGDTISKKLEGIKTTITNFVNWANEQFGKIQFPKGSTAEQVQEGQTGPTNPFALFPQSRYGGQARIQQAGLKVGYEPALPEKVWTDLLGKLGGPAKAAGETFGGKGLQTLLQSLLGKIVPIVDERITAAFSGGGDITGKGGAMPNPLTLFRETVTQEVSAIASALAGLMILWQGHVLGVGEQINQIGLKFQTLVQGLTLLQTGIGTALAGMIVQWSGHVLGVGAQIDLIGLHYQRLVQGLVLLQTGIGTALAGMIIQWSGHAAGVGAQIDILGLHYQRIVQGLVLLQSGVGNALAGMIVQWSGHAAGVGAQVDAVGQHIGRLAQDGYNGLVRVVGQALGGMIVTWSGHVSGVGSAVDGVGQHIGRLARDGYNALARVAQQSMSTMNTAWNQHKSVAASASSSAANSARNLQNAVSSAMRSIVSSMNNASNAARNLQSSINNLRGRTITITTKYVTQGARPSAEGFDGRVNSPQLFLAGEAGPEHVKITPLRAQQGFSGVVTQPTRIFAGEGNRPEHVEVTPLTNAGGRVSMNRAASSMIEGQRMSHAFGGGGGGAGGPTIRAGGSSGKANTDRVVILPNGQVAAFDTQGNVRFSTFTSSKTIAEHGRTAWTDSARKAAGKLKGLKGSEATQPTGIGKGKRDPPTSRFLATGAARISDPLRRPARAGGVVGRGGKSLFDLGIANFTGPFQSGSIAYRRKGTGETGLAWVVEERRYADGSVYRRYNTGAVEFGKDIYRLNTKYLKGTLRSGKSVKEVKYFANGKAEVTYVGDDPDDKPHKMKHNHPGPFDQGSGKSSERYTTSTSEALATRAISKKGLNPATVRAAKGWEGYVDRATQFIAGERGREYVNIQPMKDAAARRGGAGGIGGRPIVIEMHITSTLDGRVISETMRKELLGGIYSMT